MNPGQQISFNNNSLQTTNILTAEIEHHDSPQRDAKVYNMAHSSANSIPYDSWPLKVIPVSGELWGSSIIGLDGQIDTFKGYLTPRNANLDIGYNGGTRRYIGTATKIAIKRPRNLLYSNFNLEFTCQPFGQDTSATTLLATLPIRHNVVLNPSFEVNVLGWGNQPSGVTSSIKRETGIGVAGASGKGSSLILDSSGTQYGSMADSSSLRLTTAASFAFWIKTTSTTIRDLIVKTGTNSWYLVRYDNGGQILLQFYDGTTSIGGYSQIGVGDGNWHHVVATWSGSGTNVTMYIDGASVTVGFQTNGTVSPVYSTNPTYLGNGVLSGGTFQGSLSHVQIYNRQLTANEVISSYNGAYPSYGLVADLPLDQTSGTTVTDNSNNANDLTLVGAPAWGSGTGPLPAWAAAQLVNVTAGALTAGVAEGTAAQPCKPGSTYTISGYLLSVGDSSLGYANLIFYNSAGSLIFSGNNTGIALSQSGFTRVYYTSTAPAGAATVGFYFQVNVNANETAYLDGVLLEQSSTPQPYFDGSTPTDSNYVYTWDGTANNSNSSASNNRILSNYNDTLTFGGTAPYQYPIITVTYTALSGATNATVSIGNNSTGQQVNITRTWAVNDQLVIDVSQLLNTAGVQQPVTVNGLPVNYSGALAEFPPGSASIGYSDNFASRSFGYSVVNTNRYL